jgi:hypothetical protein
LGEQLHEILIPEFPLRRGTLWGEQTQASNMSVKVDYVAFSHDCQRAYLVELKTDQLSRRTTQDDYLETARRVGFPLIVEGVLQSSLATTGQAIPKYLHLLKRLADLGFVEIPAELRLAVPAGTSGGLRQHLRHVRSRVPGSGPRLQTVYIQPVADPIYNSIGFEQYAARIEGQGELGRLFSEYLRRWVTPAGESSPW